ncbi:MAG: GatB/YqeY domain-containing protein [Sphingobacteriales bacterium]|nr:GatB/YqeY domain-containing protein [Sphingobacteriales bacterium]
MSLENTINEAIKQAMKAKNAGELRALRAIKSAILLAKTAENANDVLSTDDEIKLLTKLSKQRQDAIQIYKTQQREDLAEKEIEELEVIMQFLPKQLTRDELIQEVRNIIAETGAASPKDMGKVMAIASKALAGKAEGSAVSAVVKELLNNTTGA